MPAKTQTRRLFLAAGSASAVFGALAQAAAASTPAGEPVFALIDRHKAAQARYSAARGLTDHVAAEQEGRVVTAADEAEFYEADHIFDEAESEFLMTTPTTLAGMRAYMRHCLDDDLIKRWNLAEAMETVLRSPVLAVQH